MDGRLLILVAMLLLQLYACSKKNISAPAAGISSPVQPLLPEKRINNLSYGMHPQQTMDILLPAGRNKMNTKLLVMVHGGQWTGGDKTLMEGYISLLKPRLPDFAFANINYRLINGQDVLVTAAEQDVKLALEYLWARTDSFKISGKTVLMGESAGGQLALLNAYKSGFDDIRAAVGIKSPGDLTNWYSIAVNPQVKPLLEFITGGTPVTQPSMYYNASPMNYVTPDDPPTLLIHGDADGFVNTDLSLHLLAKLDGCGITAQLILLTGEAHAFTLNGQWQVYDHIVTFLSNNSLFR